MKKIFAVLCMSLVSFFSLSALEVNQSELQSAGDDSTIEFINYNGPHKVIDSLKSIKEIGSNIGKDLYGKGGEPALLGNKAKYYVIHAVDPEEKSKLDADILILGEDAGVDHIRNLRHIISAYLSSAYGYTEKDADTIAVFVTVYNAVYRGKLDVFNTKYKTAVTKNLSADYCGLSVNYVDWPGKTEIVIPLLDPSNGGLSTVDTSVISDTQVVKSMKDDDDMNIDSRKDMVDLKERESESAEESAQASAIKAAEEQKKLNEEKEKTAEAEKIVAEAEKEAVEAVREAEASPEDKEKQAKAEEKKKALDESKQNLEKQKESEKKQEKTTAEAKEDAKSAQTFADKKITEAQTERKEIAKDQTEIQKKEAELAAVGTEVGLVLVDQSKLFSRLVKFNAKTGEIIKNSPVTTIRNRSVYKVSDGYIAIAGENGKKGAVKLVLLDNDLMEIKAESVEVICETSVLVQDGDTLYCVVQDGKDSVLGKFNSELKLLLKSNTQILESSPIVVTGSGIVVTDKKGKLVVLNKNDFEPIK